MSVRIFRAASVPIVAALALVAGGCRIRQLAPPTIAAQAESPPVPTATLTVEEARQILEDATKASTSDPATHLELAMFDLKTNATDAAEREMRECWQRFPKFARAPFQLGMLALNRGKMAEAVTFLQAAAAADQNDAQVQWNAGLACFQLGDQKRAIRYLTHAIAIDPLVPEPYLLLARCYDHHGTANLSIGYLHKYLDRTGTPGPGYYLLGRVYSRQANRDEAEVWLKKAVDTEPNNAEYWVSLGRVYFELFNATRSQDGIQCYQRALTIEPNNWAAHQYLGHALLDQRQFEPAIVHLRAALQNCPERGPLYYDLSQALLKAGHTDEGRKTLATYQGYREFQDGVDRLNRAIVDAPKDPARRYALVQFCLDHHQPTAAQSVLDEIARQSGTDAAFQHLQSEVTSMRAAAAAASSATNRSSSGDPGGAPGHEAPAGIGGGAGLGQDGPSGSSLQEGSRSGR